MITKITDLLVKHGVAYSISSATKHSCRIRIISDIGAQCIREILDLGVEELKFDEHSVVEFKY